MTEIKFVIPCTVCGKTTRFKKELNENWKETLRDKWVQMELRCGHGIETNDMTVYAQEKTKK